MFNDEEERPVLSRNQALNKFAQYILSFRILDSNSRVVSYGCAPHIPGPSTAAHVRRSAIHPAFACTGCKP